MRKEIATQDRDTHPMVDVMKRAAAIGMTCAKCQRPFRRVIAGAFLCAVHGQDAAFDQQVQRQREERARRGR